MEMHSFLPTPMALLAVLLLASLAPLPPASADITNTACTTPLVTSFTPCLFYLTGGGSGIWSTSPTDDCCKALGELLRSSAECGCLILNGNVPFALPFNRTLAITLPGACNSETVPLQCKGIATPLPPPGPISFGPSLPPFRNWPTFSPPSPSPPPAKRPPPVGPVQTTASAPTTNEELRQLDFLTSAVEPSCINRGSLLIPVAVGALITLLNRF